MLMTSDKSLQLTKADIMESNPPTQPLLQTCPHENASQRLVNISQLACIGAQYEPQPLSPSPATQHRMVCCPYLWQSIKQLRL